MLKEAIMQELSEPQPYSRNQLFHFFKQELGTLSESNFRWTLYDLQQKQLLFRADYDAYVTHKPKALPTYRPIYSDKARKILDDFAQKYPELSFVVFESILLNEFLNHQIAQNTIYIQVEKDVSTVIFEELRQEHPENILYKPSVKDFDRYWTPGCIVILELISQAPLSAEFPHEITAEKFLVDILADKSIAATFSPAELPSIYANFSGEYHVDKRRLNRYAGRRGKIEEVKKYTGGQL